AWRTDTRRLPSAARLTTDNRRLTLCVFLRVFASSREASSLENSHPRTSVRGSPDDRQPTTDLVYFSSRLRVFA
ncbi:MAG: hypothetical protein ACK5YO_19185, partial [Planctomyces sp.]